MKSRKIVFAAPWKTELAVEEVETAAVPENALVLRKHFTLVSAGTELACLSGGESWFKLPGVHGYTALSEVLAVGAGVKDFAKGDLVFHYGNHREIQVVPTTDLVLKVPAGITEKHVPFTRMATIAMTAIRVSGIELGDAVAVTGQGLVGIMAAQLARLSGGEVIALDPSAQRLELARRCGIVHTIDPSAGGVKEKVMALTGGAGVSTYIEASGVPKVFIESLPLVGKGGEAILLGSPRGEYPVNATELLNYSHLWSHGCVTVKGAHEWRYPVKHDGFVKHSFERNSRIVIDLIKSGALAIDPLLTHTLKPEQHAQAYEGLRHEKEKYIGVVFDWS
ncbi:MAG: zinc-binding alcohol dehydrogenase [Spirochaetes bacterium]|nr:zinc-binding alcohol dehydrogenase [Spirochaetota bacterium]